MKKFRSFLKKYWITVWMLIAVAAVFTVPAFSEYLRDRNKEKRVVANISTEGKRFSSDRLTNTSNDPTPYEVPVTASEELDTVTVDFQIFNHIYTDSMQYYPNPIYYQISAKLVLKDGTAIPADNIYFGANLYGIKKQADASYTYFDTYNQTLTADNSFAGTAEEGPQKYMLSFPKSLFNASDSNRVYIELDVIPYSIRTGNAGAYNYSNRITELGELKARLSVTPKAKGITVGWKGAFQEQDDNLDGFNLVFSGSGESKLYLCYDKTKLEVNKFFLDEHSGDTLFHFEDGYYYEYTDSTNRTGWTRYSNTNWTTIWIDADSDVANRYDIQLYMNDTVISYSQIGSYVKYNDNAPATYTDVT